MGLWERFCACWDSHPDLDWWAARKVANIRRAVRVNYHDPAEAIPIEVACIKSKIHIRNEVGGLVQYRKAFHIWKAAQKLYPERITEDDKPIQIPC